MTKKNDVCCRRSARAALRAAMGLTFAFSLSSCTSPAVPDATDNTIDVAMRSIAFDPPVVTITQGQSVRWTNLEGLSIIHTTTSGNPEDADLGVFWDSGNLSPGESFTQPFNEIGEFIYFCEIHPIQMRDAKVIVTAP